MGLSSSKSAGAFSALAVLLVALAVVAGLQYYWLGQISRIGRERLQSRLQSNVKRFADEFNAEIKKAYFIFQVDSRVWENTSVVTERLDLWRKQGTTPELVNKIYFVRQTARDGGAEELREFNFSSGMLEPAAWTGEVSVLKERLRSGSDGKPSFDSVAEDVPAIVIPILQNRQSFVPESAQSASAESSPIAPGDFVIVILDREAIKTVFIPKLAGQYLTTEGDVSYDFSVISRSEPNNVILASGMNIDFSKSDASIAFFELKPDINAAYLAGSETAVVNEQGVTVAIKRRIGDDGAPPSTSPLSSGTTVETDDNAGSSAARNQKQITVLKTDKPGGRWLLNVRHSTGSLDDFIGTTRWKNLAISFGVLILLGASAVLLIVATHRAGTTARRQMDFVSSVSHEFRTPVSVICSAGQNLAEGFVKEPGQTRKYGKIIYHEGLRLTEMIEHILEFAGARDGRKKYNFQRVNVSALLESVLLDSKYLLEEKNIEVEKKIEENLPAAWVDAESLHLSLRNLISNAVKYSNGNKWVGISVEANDGYIRISVADKGIGIDAQEIEHIFDPFFRGKRAVAEQIKGNGLGLSLIKQTVKAQRGNIRVESKPQRGSIFTIQIPAYSENRASSNESQNTDN